MYMVLELWTEDALQASVIRCYICAVYNVIKFVYASTPSIPLAPRHVGFSFFLFISRNKAGTSSTNQFLYLYIYYINKIGPASPPLLFCRASRLRPSLQLHPWKFRTNCARTSNILKLLNTQHILWANLTMLYGLWELAVFSFTKSYRHVLCL